MCAKAISQHELHGPLLETTLESSMTEEATSNLGTLGKTLSEVLDTPVSILGEDHIRIATSRVVGDDEIRSLRELIANSLYLPVNIFRERKYLEIVAI
jgi:hypothetical protein